MIYEMRPEVGFALMLEQACEAFEALQDIIGDRVSISSPNARSSTTICRALAQSFLFSSSRAYRICEHGKGSILLPREARREFLRKLKPVVEVRDVNEHGYDLNTKSGKAPTRPRMHDHPDHLCTVDETSLVIVSESEILMGPLNLCEVYEPVAAMRAVAGFQALHAQGKL